MTSTQATNTAEDDRPSEQVQSVQKEVAYNGKTYDTLKEGLAEILIPRGAPKATNGPGNGKSKPSHQDDCARQTVFYNPIQQYNRDLTVLAIRAFSEDLAAVRLARHTQKESNLKQAEGRGKKRKRRADHEGSKKINAGEALRAPLEADACSKEATPLEPGTVEASVGTEVEGKDSEALQDHGEAGEECTQNGDRNDTDANPDLAEQSLPGAENTTTPQGPKHKPKASLPFRILDALSASGLRALRYAKEIPMTTSVTANDLSSSAAENIELNVAHNALASRVLVNTGDAIQHMHSTKIRTDNRMPQLYHVIDLDPYGTAAPFLDAAVQAITDGGLLCITCTDAGVFASKGYSEKTYSQYGGLPVKGPHAHEAGLRLILHAIATSAARYGIGIEPLLSLNIDFYARVFVRVHHSPADVKFLASKTMTLYQCDTGCGSWATQFLAHAKQNENRNGDIFYKFTGALGPSAGKECEHCGFRTHLAGPMWGGPLHNPMFIQRILEMLPDLNREVYPTVPRIEGMLSLALNEDLDDPWISTAHTKNQSLANDPPSGNVQPPTTETTTNNSTTKIHQNTNAPSGRPVPPVPVHYRIRYPFFIHPSSIARVLNITTPSDASLRGALCHLGYLTSRSHTKPGSIITNAPFTVIWEIMREWVRQEWDKQSNPQKSPLYHMNPNTAGARIFKNDRSQSQLQSTKQKLRARIDEAKSAQDLRSELQAALYRLDNPDKQLPTTNGSSTGNDLSDKNQPPPTDIIALSPAQAPPATEIKGFAEPPEIALSKLNKLEVRFDERLGKDTTRFGANGKKKMVRYQMNPTENWGPKGKAKG